MIVLTVLLTFQNLMESNKVRRSRVSAEDDIKNIKGLDSVEFSTHCLSKLMAVLLKSVSGQNRFLPHFGIRDLAGTGCVPLKFSRQNHQLR